MRLGRLGEFGAIARIKSLCRPPGRGVRVGVGDDAAVFQAGPGLMLASADMMVEGVHFEAGTSGWRDLGYKALASNLSDIAAMGGRPRYYMVSVALRSSEAVRSLDELYQGFEEAAGPHKVRLIGGDTTGTPGPAVVSVTILGEAGPKGAVTRKGARPGDHIYVTGTLGDSAAGLELLKTGAGGRKPGIGRRVMKSYGPDEDYLISRHLRPTARVEAGAALGASGAVTAMIDVSDGLSSDLGHLLDESGVGALMDGADIPLSGPLVGRFGKARSLRFALDGGEDYELLFTVRPAAASKIERICEKTGAGCSLIGEITREKGAYLVTGKGRPRQLRPRGYEHFRK